MERLETNQDAGLPPAIRVEVEKLYEMTGVDPVINYLNDLLKQVQDMPLGSQFSSDRPINENYITQAPSGAFQGKSKDEVTHKKTSLEVEGVNVRQEFLQSVSKLRDFLVHVRISQLDFNSPEVKSVT